MPIKTIHVSDRGRFGFARLNHSRHGTDAMGYAVPARELGAAMDRRLRRLVDAAMICPAEVTDLARTAGPGRTRTTERFGSEVKLRGGTGGVRGWCGFDHAALAEL